MLEIKNNNLDSLCWNITGICNENCKFCYRKKCKDNTLEENKKIVDNLFQINIKKISFCGGEPLLYENLFSLVRYIRKKNPNVELSITTNGKCIDEEKLKKILTYFNWISFPIDSTNAVINEEIGRGYEHLDKIIQLLEECNNKIKMKINTVATQLNKEEIENIYHIISQYSVMRWKIFRFFPIRGAQEYKDLFYLDEKEAKNIQILLQRLNKKNNLKIEYNDFEGKPSCFSIQPDGVVEASNNITLGNFLEDSVYEIIRAKRLEIENYNK